MSGSGRCAWDDLVFGELGQDVREIGDVILRRSDGHPLYNLAVVVDDAELAELLAEESVDRVVDALVRAALDGGAPDNVTVVVADVVEDECVVRNGRDPDPAVPLGSMFKLYVLGAVVDAVEAASITTMLPFSQSKMSVGSTRFASRAAAAVTILNVEPGSYTSVTARFRQCPAG